MSKMNVLLNGSAVELTGSAMKLFS